MLIDFSPLKKYRDFRLLYIGQVVSYIGSMMSYVAIPYQVYQLSKDSFLVGALGAVQIIPILVFGLIGGSLADRMDRRKLLIYSELVMVVGVLILMINSLVANPSVVLIFVLTFIIQSANAYHRPAMEAITQHIVEAKDYGSIGALSSLRHTTTAIVGPALGGVLIAQLGAGIAYAIDAATFLIAIFCLMKMKTSGINFDQLQKGTHQLSSSSGKSHKATVKKDIIDGVRYAFSKPELVGTYLIDIVAMTFAFPTALFPQMAEEFGKNEYAGLLFSGMAIGSFLISILSGWTSKIKRHGVMVVISASLWGVAIVGLGFSPDIYWAMFFLILAGALDMLSALYRSIIWNETIPNDRRGRLAGIEMISYMTGPLLGNFRAGMMAGKMGLFQSIAVGGWICFFGVIITALFLPKFWSFRSKST